MGGWHHLGDGDPSQTSDGHPENQFFVDCVVSEAFLGLHNPELLSLFFIILTNLESEIKCLLVFTAFMAKVFCKLGAQCGAGT